MRFATPGLALWLLLGACAVEEEPAVETVEATTDDLDLLLWITGFHHVFDEERGLSFRILEADASATVAMNPVSLFLVVTNGDPAEPVEQVWRLLFGVSRFQSLKL